MLPANNQSPTPTDEFLKIGFKVLSESAGLAQFYDRDTTPEMAKEGMKGFQEFMVKPERENRFASVLKECVSVFSRNSYLQGRKLLSTYYESKFLGPEPT